ncbi:TMEM175 family protein [Sphaerisporangium corydalis]|uniref:TMEM175 family protein n=1 Tax=Sphaerisporangium corydalis TaxID=1441875 RepID=A0ABV9EQH2_9ACTN|nr:TMEM175 family protein [Sphaerisporangium corydalis]
MSESDPPATAPVPPGLSHERVGMFSDAVFAIAMTLLVIEIPRPEKGDGVDGTDRMVMARELWHFLGANGDIFLAFVIAFLMLWTAWRQHHRLLDQITRMTSPMLIIHIPLLIFVVLLPYTTSLIGEAARNPLSVTLFAGSEAVLLLCQAALLSVAVRSGVTRPGADVRQMRIVAVMLVASAAFWSLTGGLSWLTAGIEYSWILIPVVARTSSRVADRFVRTEPARAPEASPV